MDTVLVTGFAPFGGEPVNPSFEIARALDGQVLAGRRLVARELPCVFGEALATLDDALATHRPVLVLALGQAARRDAMSVERVAINVDDAPLPDNAGAQPVDRPVVPGGPVGYLSTLPIKAIAAALRDAGLPAEVSQTAGTYVCNHVFYGLQHRLAGQGVPSGFLHVPLMDTQAVRHPGRPGLPLADMVRGVRVALETALAVMDGERAAAPSSGDRPASEGAVD